MLAVKQWVGGAGGLRRYSGNQLAFGIKQAQAFMQGVALNGLQIGRAQRAYRGAPGFVVVRRGRHRYGGLGAKSGQGVPALGAQARPALLLGILPPELAFQVFQPPQFDLRDVRRQAALQAPVRKACKAQQQTEQQQDHGKQDAGLEAVQIQAEK
ncbi:hypothetical protein D3C72_1439900 [compost metagenome]